MAASRRGLGPLPAVRPASPASRPAPAVEEAARRAVAGMWSSPPSVARSLLEVPFLGAIAVAIVVVVRLAFVQAFYIPSGSMLPQLQLQDKVIVSRMAYRLHSPRRGDIVVFDAPPRAQELEGTMPPGGSSLRRALRWTGQRLGLTARQDEFIKRVIALPGETVEGHDGHVYVNGRLLLEPYLPAGTQTQPFPKVKVPPGHLWVMGDNRGNSQDSRFFGAVRERTVVGRAFLRVWPGTHLAFL